MMPDKFPEAYKRFEQVIDLRSFESYRQLAYAFSHWAGKRWVDSYAQNRALKREAQRIGIIGEIPAYHKRQFQYHFPEITWRHETIKVKGKSQERYRDIKTGRFIKKPK
jgi:hypothetical protein